MPRIDTRFLNEIVTSKAALPEPTDSVECLVEQGAQRWKEILARLASKQRATTIHVVPLSGGLDSRAVLGALLENTSRSQLMTASFGTAGSWDFDIGIRVAKEVGVRHEMIDLEPTNFDWRTENLVAMAQRYESPGWIFDRYINAIMVNRFPAEALFWSGYMGDPVAGSHLPVSPTSSWTRAIYDFCLRNSFQDAIKLTPQIHRPHLEDLPAPLHPLHKLSYEEQLDFAVRQASYVRPVVLPAGVRWETPFLDPEWLAFILNVPSRMRTGQTLYKAMLLQAYPQLFRIPTKTHRGLGLHANRAQRGAHAILLALQDAFSPPTSINGMRNRASNYFNFDEALRSPTSYSRLCRENLSDLHYRGIVDWVDLDRLWQCHQKRAANFGMAISLLVSLEVALKAGTKLECASPT